MDRNDIIKKKYLYEVLQASIIAGLVFVMILFSTSENETLGFSLLLMAIFASGGIGQLFLTKKVKALKIAYKNLSVISVFEEKYPNFTYKPDEGFDKEEVYKTGILKKEDRYNSEDYLAGEVAGKTFESAEIHLEDRRSNGKHTYYVTVFRGRFYKVYIPQAFPVGVYILPKHYNSFKFNMNYAKFEVEGIEFSKKFNVYSNDHTEALLRVRPKVIDRILTFSKKVKKVMIGFEGHYIYIAVDTRVDQFDLQLFKPLDMDVDKEIREELKLTEDLIELLT